MSDMDLNRRMRTNSIQQDWRAFLKQEVPSLGPSGPAQSSSHSGAAHNDNSPPYRVPLSARDVSPRHRNDPPQMPHFANLRDGGNLPPAYHKAWFWFALAGWLIAFCVLGVWLMNATSAAAAAHFFEIYTMNGG